MRQAHFVHEAGRTARPVNAAPGWSSQVSDTGRVTAVTRHWHRSPDSAGRHRLAAWFLVSPFSAPSPGIALLLAGRVGVILVHVFRRPGAPAGQHLGPETDQLQERVDPGERRSRRPVATPRRRKSTTPLTTHFTSVLCGPRRACEPPPVGARYVNRPPGVTRTRGACVKRGRSAVSAKRAAQWPRLFARCRALAWMRV